MFRQCGRFSQECGQTELDSFKPETIQEFGLTDEPLESTLDQNDNQGFEGKSSAEEDAGRFDLLNTIKRDRHNYRICSAHCKITTFLEGLDFCDSIYHYNSPRVCSRSKVFNPSAWNNSSSSEPPNGDNWDGKNEPTVGFQMSTNKPVGFQEGSNSVDSNDGTYRFEFDVQIKVVMVYSHSHIKVSICPII